MPCYQEVICPNCGSNRIIKAGKSTKGIQRYTCQNKDCPTKSFMQEYCYKAYEPGIKKQVIDMAINGSGIRDTARVLGINKNTVIDTLKKRKKYHPRQSELSDMRVKKCPRGKDRASL